jgi:dTDP-4-dehydrorhamnose reductase
MEKIFICGIGGLVGSKLVDLCKGEFEIFGSFNLREPNVNNVKSFQLDITNHEKLKNIIEKIKPDIIINATALNNVDYCEEHKDEANKVNVKAVCKLSEISNSLNSKFVHLSTDSVFDGTKKEPYNELDNPNPINNYGRSKLYGENEVLKFENNIIVRASVLYGWLPKALSSKKTSSLKQINFAQWLISKLKLKEKVNITSEEFSSPIIADDFAKSTLHLILNKESGIFHSAPALCINRYDFSIKLAKYLDLDSSLIIPITTEKLGRSVTTAKNKCLNSTKLINTNFRFLTLNQSVELIKQQMLI